MAPPGAATQRPDYYPRPAEERQLGKRKSVMPGPAQTPGEAAFDMETMDYDFYLFTDVQTGQLALLVLPAGRHRRQGRRSQAGALRPGQPPPFRGRRLQPRRPMRPG